VSEQRSEAEWRATPTAGTCVGSGAEQKGKSYDFPLPKKLLRHFAERSAEAVPAK